MIFVARMWTRSSSSLEFIEEVLLIHEHILPAIRVGRGQDLGVDARERAGLPSDLAASRLDLLSTLVHILPT